MDVVFTILELLHNFANEDNDELGDTVQISLSELQVQVHLAVESVEAHIYESFDLELSEEVTERPVFIRTLPSAVITGGPTWIITFQVWVICINHRRHSHDVLDCRVTAIILRLAIFAVSVVASMSVFGFRSSLLLELFIGIDHEGKPVRDFRMEFLLVMVRLVAKHWLEDDILRARGDVQVLEKEELTED